MIQRWYHLIVIIITVGLISGCSSTDSSACPFVMDNSTFDTNISGTIIVLSWWQESERQILNDIFTQFMDIYPNVKIVHNTYNTDNFETYIQRYIKQAELGLGPDMLIGMSHWIPELAEKELIEDISQCNIDTSHYLSNVLKTVHYQPQTKAEGLYGIPLSLHTSALYYNEALLNGLHPPKTLSELEIQAYEKSHKIVIPTDFYHGFWGLKPFGGHLLNDKGELALNQGGFANWLDWLKEAQSDLDVILVSNSFDNSSQGMFTNGEVTYYVGRSDELVAIQEAFEKQDYGDVMRVVPLPGNGPSLPSGPLLQTETMMFNPASSPTQKQIAYRLAQFLASEEQQRKFVTQKTSRIPANTKVRVDPQVYPAWAGFIDQTKTAEPLPNNTITNPIVWDGLGDEVYIQALEGAIGINDAINGLTERIKTTYRYPIAEINTRLTCPSTAEIEVWHRWTTPETNVLRQLVRRIELQCPALSITVKQIAADHLLDHYQEAVEAGGGPDLLIGSNHWIGQLAFNDVITNVGSFVELDILQGYQAEALNATVYQEQLYGLPQSMNVLAMYYNAEYVTDPAQNTDDLQIKTSPQQQAFIPIGFYHGMWGITTFNAISFDENYIPTYNTENFLAWLNWLSTGQAAGHFLLSSDISVGQKAFETEEVIFFIGPATLIHELYQTIGSDHLRAINLPTNLIPGTEQLLEVETIMLNPNSSATKASLDFALYLTNPTSQQLFLEQAYHIPSHTQTVIDPTTHPIVAVFSEQAKMTNASPNHPLYNDLGRLGNTIYIEVLENGQDPEPLIEPYLESLQTHEAVQDSYGTAD